MTPSKLISIILARWSLVLLVVVLTTLTALGVSLSMQPKYVAAASVLIDAKPDPISALIYPGLASPSYMNTQVDVIASDRVALRVVKDLKLTDNPEVRQQWMNATGGNGSMEQWLANGLKGNMEVKPSKESNVLMVTYKSPQPDAAAAFANAFVRAYVGTTLELRVDPAVSTPVISSSSPRPRSTSWKPPRPSCPPMNASTASWPPTSAWTSKAPACPSCPRNWSRCSR